MHLAWLQFFELKADPKTVTKLTGSQLPAEGTVTLILCQFGYLVTALLGCDCAEMQKKIDVCETSHSIAIQRVTKSPLHLRRSLIKGFVGGDFSWHPGDFRGRCVYWAHIRTAEKKEEKGARQGNWGGWISLLETMTNLSRVGEKLCFLFFLPVSFAWLQNILWQPSRQLGTVRRDLGEEGSAVKKWHQIPRPRAWRYFLEFSTPAVNREMKHFKGGNYSLVGEDSACAGETGHVGLILGQGRAPGGGNAPCSAILVWKTPVDRRAWCTTVQRVTKSGIWLSVHARVCTHTHTYQLFIIGYQRCKNWENWNKKFCYIPWICVGIWNTVRFRSNLPWWLKW